MSTSEAQALRRLMSKASTADECRLLLDMFLAKSGIPIDAADYDAPYPSPLSERPERQSADMTVENFVVELILSGESPAVAVPRKRRATRKKVPPLIPPGSEGTDTRQSTPTQEVAAVTS